MIHHQSISEVYSKKSAPLWLISAFKAGFINSAGFLATGRFVSHVTGFGTTVGVAVGHEDYFFGAELLIIPISFIAGGVVTSLVLDKKYSSQEIPSYWKIQGLITLLILTVIILGESHLINETEKFDVDNKFSLIEFIVIGILCFVCGLKNSLVTWSSFGKIKVTHLTGLSTDIGLNFLRLFKKDWYSPRFKEERKVNILRISTFIAFSSGALVSAILFPKLLFKVFFIIFFLSFIMTIISLFDRFKWKKHLKSMQSEASMIKNL